MRWARSICEKLADATAPVAFFLPTAGCNEWDRAGGDLHDAAGLSAFCEEMRSRSPANVDVLELPCHINDVAFTVAVLARFDRWVADGVISH